MFEILRWVSMGLMWAAFAMNLLSWHNYAKLRRKLKVREQELESRERYCITMIHACTEFLESVDKQEDLTSEEK